ncbi:MAG TPA: hydroxyacid dehydrogenase [Candidatus Binatus sp.]|nr:hydroxyacid dehydrogenase [Candidatus Binatus sp.]
MRALVCDHIGPEGLEILRRAGLQVDEDPRITMDNLVTRVRDYEILIVRGRTKVDSNIMNAGRNLKIIGRSGVGLDNIDLNAARARDIKVLNTPGAPTTSVAELTIGLILSLLRKINYADHEMKQGHWIKNELVGRELQGKRVGIIGLAGRIGGKVARILTVGFEADVWGYDVIQPRGVPGLTYELARSLEELLEGSDIVSVHIPYAAQTHHLLNRERLGRMKKGAYLVNTSRGDIVDGRALNDLLKNGHLGGAGLDVFHSEPPIDDWEKEMVTLPKGVTVVTCHVGAQTLEAQRKEGIELAEKILADLHIEPPRSNEAAPR